MAGAIPSLIILASSTIASVVGVAVVTLVMGVPILIILDLPGLFLLTTAVPLMIFGVVAVMIIISGRVTRVYEAYQMTTGMIMVFMIPIILPMLGLETGNVGNLVWLSNFTTLIISVTLFSSILLDSVLLGLCRLV